MGLLDGMFGGSGQRGGGMSPITMALMGLLAYRTYQGKGRLADMLGRTGMPGDKADPQAGTPASGGAGGLGGLLGGLFGGSAGGLLSGGLGDLLKQFQQNGHGDKAQSWVAPGANQPIEPNELEKALGPQRIEWLMEQTGMSREELLRGMSEQLPEFVDKLTPDGRIPTQDEAQRMV
jgi:uncharacterized protein YidB (DUF937 family)